MIKQITSILVALCCYGNGLQAVIIGSNTTPSRQGLATFPAVDLNNTMLGFASFESGFTLQNAATTCVFNSFFPVGGTSTFNGGTLNLSLNLAFTSTASIVNTGVINGNNLLVQLPERNGTFTLNGMIFSSAYVSCGSDVTLNGIARFNGTSTLDCQGKTVNCAGGAIVVGTSGSLLIKNGTLNNVSGSRFFCVDNSGTFSFSNVTFVQDAAYTFSQGRINVLDSLRVTGGQAFTYASSAASTIASDATWYFDVGSTFAYAPSIAARNLIVMTDATSILSLNTTSLSSTTTGLLLTRGTLQVDGLCPVSSTATVVAQAITFGDGASAANDLTVQFMAGSGFNITSGLMAYNNVNG